MFHVDNLTGHVRMRTRQELARMVRYVAEKIGLATPTKDGLMPATDKAKLDGLGVATTSKNGLLSAGDKAKLNRLRSQMHTPSLNVNVTSSGCSFAAGYDKGLASYVDYLVLCFNGTYAGATTFNLNAFRNGLNVGICGATYFLLVNNSAADINVVATGIKNNTDGFFGPSDTVVPAGGKREASLYIGGNILPVLTMSETLNLIS